MTPPPTRTPGTCCSCSWSCSSSGRRWLTSSAEGTPAGTRRPAPRSIWRPWAPGRQSCWRHIRTIRLSRRCAMRTCPPAHNLSTGNMLMHVVKFTHLKWIGRVIPKPRLDYERMDRHADAGGPFGQLQLLAVPGLSEKAALLMHPSEVFNWLGTQASMVSRDFACPCLHISSNHEWSRASMAIDEPQGRQVSSLRNDLKRLCAYMQPCDAGSRRGRSDLHCHADPALPASVSRGAGQSPRSD